MIHFNNIKYELKIDYESNTTELYDNGSANSYNLYIDNSIVKINKCLDINPFNFDQKIQTILAFK